MKDLKDLQLSVAELSLIYGGEEKKKKEKQPSTFRPGSECLEVIQRSHNEPLIYVSSSLYIQDI